MEEENAQKNLERRNSMTIEIKAQEVKTLEGIKSQKLEHDF
jgi:hypothetical protein